MKKKSFIFYVVTIATMIFFISNCRKVEHRIYNGKNAFENIDVVFQFNRVESKQLLNETYSFVYFKYIIKNYNKKRLYFNPGNIRVMYNGKINESTEYDSIASPLTEIVELPKGDSEFSLYLVFKRENIDEKINNFSIIDTGIIKNSGE